MAVRFGSRELGAVASARTLGKRKLHKKTLPSVPSTHRDLAGHPFEENSKKLKKNI